jgi:hypothetical protein
MKTITTTPVESSQIAAIGHDGADTLQIDFPRKSGGVSRYQYSGVSPELFEAFKSAESIGSFFYKHIKPYPNHFPYTRLEDEKEKGAAA